MERPLVVVFSVVCEDGIEEIERPIIEESGAEVVSVKDVEEFEKYIPLHLLLYYLQYFLPALQFCFLGYLCLSLYLLV